jgi:hypothetical protein
MFLRLNIIGTACLLFATAANADVKSAIVHNFSANPQFLVLNLPPRPDAWPGAIFTANLRYPITHGDPKDPALHSGPPIAINSDEGLNLGAGAKGGISSFFGVSSDAADNADVAMSFPDAHIVDMDYGDLVRHVQASKDAVDAAKQGIIPVLVVKAYAGTPVITITKKASASADSWAKLKANVEAGVKAIASNQDSVSYNSGAPFVFAFETSEVHFDPDDLKKGRVSVQLASMPEQVFAARDAEAQKKQNTLALEGSEASLGNTLPLVPPGSFQAYCSVVPGLCLVQGNGVIAPGTPCHCGVYAGQTW